MINKVIILSSFGATTQTIIIPITVVRNKKQIVVSGAQSDGEASFFLIDNL